MPNPLGPGSGPIKIVIAGEPEAAPRPRFAQIRSRAGSFVHAYHPAHFVKWQRQVRFIAQEAMNGRPPLSGPVCLELAVFLPVPKSFSNKRAQCALDGSLRPVTRPDLDNYIKAFDSLNTVVWLDDSQIVELRARKVYSDRPRIELTAYPFVNGQDAQPTEANLFSNKTNGEGQWK